MFLFFQQRRVNIFKSFSSCTPTSSGFVTVARHSNFPWDWLIGILGVGYVQRQTVRLL